MSPTCRGTALALLLVTGSAGAGDVPATVGTWGDPLRQPHAGFVRAGDAAAIVLPLGMAADMIGYEEGGHPIVFPYRWRLLRGGGFSRWRHEPAPRLLFGPLAGARRGGLLGAASGPPPAAPGNRLDLRIGLVESRADAGVDLAGDRGHARLTALRSTLAAFDELAGGAFVVPEIQRVALDTRLRGHRGAIRIFAARTKEDVTRDAGTVSNALDDLGIDLQARRERAGVSLTPAGSNLRHLGLTQEYDRSAVLLVDGRDRRIADATVSAAHTDLRADVAVAPFEAGVEIRERTESLTFARDDVPQHRFPGPPSMTMNLRWTEGAVWAGTAWRRTRHTLEVDGRLAASEGYRGVGWAAGARYTFDTAGWLLSAGAARRAAFPGVEAMLGRTLPVDLSRQPGRRPESAWTGVLEAARAGGTAARPWRVHLQASGAGLTRVFVPLDRLDFAARDGTGRAWQLAAGAAAQLARASLHGSLLYARTGAELEEGVYRTGTKTAGVAAHIVDLRLAWTPRRWLACETGLTGRSGLATTPVVGRVPVVRVGFDEVLPVLGAPGSEILPARYRLDLGVAVSHRTQRVDWGLRAEVLNVLGRVNPTGWRWNDDFTRRVADGMLPRIAHVELSCSLRR